MDRNSTTPTPQTETANAAGSDSMPPVPPPRPPAAGEQEVASQPQPPSVPASKPLAPPEAIVQRQQQQTSGGASVHGEDGGKGKTTVVGDPQPGAGEVAGGSGVSGEGDGTPGTGRGSTPAALAAAAEPPDPNDDDAARQKRHVLVKRLQKVIRAVQFMTRLKRRSRPPEEGEEGQTPAAAATLKGKKETRQARWKSYGEARLESILEDTFTRLIAAEFNELSSLSRRCLLTFSVLPVGRLVRKKAVTDWWAVQYGSGAHGRRRAEEIFGELCDGGFLEPIKKRCSGVLQGCRVNPLVHWMVKRQARDGGFADLDERGDLADQQPANSAVLFLTASYHQRLQQIASSDESPSPKTKRKPGLLTRTPSQQGPQQSSGRAKEQQNDKTKLELQEFDNIRLVLNINARVYRLPGSLLSYLGSHLVMLQLGRWWNFDDNTYIEMEGLENLSTIGNLKNLRYLGIRGLSKLTKLPKEVNQLQQLEVLDVCGCQNLTRVMSSTIKTLRRLTHLDLTECYMLEHIGREIASLSELQVFKGFVFGIDVEYRNKACRLRDLGVRMRNLWKLSIDVTPNATINKNEMAQLRHLNRLISLTITWGELPSIFTSIERIKEKKHLLDRWTGLVLPPNLEKLDVRCYPSIEIPREWFEPKVHSKPTMLTKLYVRGGPVEKLNLPEDNNIKILRLKYLNKFKMRWDEMFHMMKNLSYVEVIVKHAKMMKSEKRKDRADNVELEPHMVRQEKNEAKEEQEKLMANIKKVMGIPKSFLDEQVVWECHQKEAE